MKHPALKWFIVKYYIRLETSFEVGFVAFSLYASSAIIILLGVKNNILT